MTDEEIIDESQFEDDEGTTNLEDDESQIDSEEDNSLSKPKRNKSNWKKLSLENKRLKRELEALKASGDEDYEDEEDEDDLRKEVSLLKYFASNPDAQKYKDGINRFLSKYPDADLDDAFVFAKAQIPKTSQSKNDLSLRSTGSKPKELKDLAEEEAVEKLDPMEYLKYQRLKGTLQE